MEEENLEKAMVRSAPDGSDNKQFAGICAQKRKTLTKLATRIKNKISLLVVSGNLGVLLFVA